LHKSKVLALTVPEAGVRAAATRQRLGARRDALNSSIKAFARPNFYAFDFHAALPYFALSEEDIERYWDDSVHLTPDGYDLMGEKIAAAMEASLRAEFGTQGDSTSEAAKPARKRKAFKDDENVFEEEVGDPSAINQGYIVVRKRDLD